MICRCSATGQQAEHALAGLGTIVHVIRLHIWRTKYYFGTGIVSVMGITTTQVSTQLSSAPCLPRQAQLLLNHGVVTSCTS